MKRNVRLLALYASRAWRESADFIGRSVNAVGAGHNGIDGRGRLAQFVEEVQRWGDSCHPNTQNDNI